MVEITAKQRAYLKGLANSLQPVYQIGKNGILPDLVEGVDQYLEANELIKVTVLKNCDLDIREAAETLAGRTRSHVVQVIGRKLVLYRESRKKPTIELPKDKKKV